MIIPDLQNNIEEGQKRRLYETSCSAYWVLCLAVEFDGLMSLWRRINRQINSYEFFGFTHRSRAKICLLFEIKIFFNC